MNYSDVSEAVGSVVDWVKDSRKLLIPVGLLLFSWYGTKEASYFAGVPFSSPPHPFCVWWGTMAVMSGIAGLISSAIFLMGVLDD